MSLKIINEINKFSSYRFDESDYKIVNTRTQDMADIDEFLEIVHILDNHHVQFIMGKNYSIKILGRR